MSSLRDPAIPGRRCYLSSLAQRPNTSRRHCSSRLEYPFRRLSVSVSRVHLLSVYGARQRRSTLGCAWI